MAFHNKLYKYIAHLIPENSKVLDLGCGDGTLLEHLIKEKKVIGHGIDIDSQAIVKCIEKGIPVIQRDFDKNSLDFPDNSFDIVVLNRTLQQVNNPVKIIDELLRIGKMCILGFPNFGNARNRLKLGLTGMLPQSYDLPYAWYDTPNIRLLTVKDFRNFCKEFEISIVNTQFLKHVKNTNSYLKINHLINLRCDMAIFQLQKR